MIADDIRTIERKHHITIYEAYHVHNFYHLFATQYGGSGVEFFTYDTAPFGFCWGGECDVNDAWFTPIREHVQYPIHSIHSYGGLLVVKTTGDVRYFNSKALPAVIEYVVTEEYIDGESE